MNDNTYWTLRTATSRGYPKEHAATYAIETEPGIFAVIYHLHDAPLLSRSPGRAKLALLYVSHRSADDELRTEPLLRELMHADRNTGVFTCDVRAIGESQPNAIAPRHFDSYGSDCFYAIHACLLGFRYAAQRTHDVLRVIDCLKANARDNIHLFGKGWGAIPVALVALLSDEVKQVTLKHALTSFSEIAESEDHD